MTKAQSECTHSETTSSKFIQSSGEYECTEGYWEHGEEFGTWEDISISQYRCTKCGLVFNYSGGNPHHVLDDETDK